MMDARFEACLPFILDEEGGNDDDPHDHGGRTSRGITQREYSAWCVKHGLRDRDVWGAPNIVVHDIYYDEYWLPHGPKLHPGVDLVYFNFAVNAGAGEAHKLLMRSIGPDDEDNDAQTINRMCNEGEHFYRGLALFPRYGRGWTARTERIRAAALKMQKESPVMGPHDPLPPQKPKPTQTQGTDTVNIFALITAIPQIIALVTKYWPAVQALIQGFQHLAKTMSEDQALETIINHNTPGKPNSPALS